MGNSLADLIRETLLPSEEEFVIGEVAGNEDVRSKLNRIDKGYLFGEVDTTEEGRAILNLMGEGYSYLEAVEKLEKERREKEHEQLLREVYADEEDRGGICVWHRDEPGDFDW